jgi:hypothetical protein
VACWNWQAVIADKGSRLVMAGAKE